MKKEKNNIESGEKETTPKWSGFFIAAWLSRNKFIIYYSSNIITCISK